MKPVRLIRFVQLIVLALLLTACALPGGLTPVLPNPVSPNGVRISELYDQISIPAIFIFLLVEALLLWVVLRYRRSKQPTGYVPPQLHGNTKLEVTWTLIPLAIVLIIATLSFFELQRDFAFTGSEIAPAQGPTDLSLTVTAYQFGWAYDYPQGFTLHQPGKPPPGDVEPVVVPVGKLVRMTVRSRDVIHSWWVPALTGKTDAVPGYDNFTWFRVTQPGMWRGQCAELCGVGHSTMIIIVKAVPEAEFEQWVADQLKKAQPAAPSPTPASSPPPSPSPTASS